MNSQSKVLELIDDIKTLISFHCDFDADEYNKSPDDMWAHHNGLIYRKCEEIEKELKHEGKNGTRV
jgi:hypothetical protein